jgi:hypothetical protein
MQKIRVNFATLQKPTLRRFAIGAIIVVLVVASIGAAIVYNQVTATKLNVIISTNEINMLQGNSAKIPIRISLTGNPEKITLTSIVNASKINCYFDPATGSSSFNTKLTVNVDDSAQGGNYSVTVKASSSTTSANASCIIMVLSRNVTVSGKINIASSIWDMQLDSLIFENTRTDEKVTIKPQIKDETFTLTLKNQDFYYVTANYSFGVLDFLPFSRSIIIGNLTVSTPAGSNMMPGQDFTLIPQY